MQQITKPLTEVIWYGPSLTLSAAPWKTSVDLVRQLKAAGTGYTSFDPASSFNSLTTVSSGQIITVQAKAAAIAGSGFAIDNGVAPSAPGNDASILVVTFAAGGAKTQQLPRYFATQSEVYNLDPSNPPAGLTAISYVKGGVVVNLPVTLAPGEVLTVNATTQAGAGGTLVLLKQ